MPVKSEHSLLASVFESEQFAMDSVVSSPSEDIWKKFDDFLLTPPQSPPVKLDFASDSYTDDDFSSALDGFLESSLTESALAEVLNSYGPPDVDVLHDCMWSGPVGFEDPLCAGNMNANRPSFRSETPLLSTSPLGLSGFNDMLATCPEMDVTDAMETEVSTTLEEDSDSSNSQHSQVSEISASSGFISSTESFINDHSYGSPKCSPKPQPLQTQSQSLIYPSPTYKVLTRTRNGLKVKKVDKDIHALSPQVTVKFVKRSANALKESTVSYSKKQVKQCISKANVVKKSLGSCLSRYTLSASSPTTSAATNNTSIASCSSIPLNSNKSVELNITATPMVTSVKKVSAIAKSSPTKTKPMYPERRREHNDSERKRRDHLRDAFHALRDQVPSLKDSSKKPARITILHEASSYVYELIDQSRSLEKTRDTELQKREKLLKKLALLKVKRLS